MFPMSNVILNWSNDTKFYCLEGRKLLTTSETLIPRKVVASDLENYYKCGVFVSRRPTPNYPVASLIAIPPKTEWEEISGVLTYRKTLTFSKLNPDVQISRVDKAIQKYLILYKDKKIAIENSGGLDSSLIIEYLNKFEFRPILIGCVMSGYEARTERVIQEKYFARFQNSEVIQQTITPAFAELGNIPAHPLPTPSSLFYHRHLVTAQIAAKNNISVVLNGSSGDNLLGNSFKGLASGMVPDGYHDWCLSDKWVSEFIYGPLNMHYISPYSLPPLLRAIVSMRSLESEDYMKLWARKKFSNILPYELVHFAYKASHDNWIADGLRAAESEIYNIAKTSYEIVGHKDLKPDRMISDAKNYFHQKDDEHHKFLMRLSYAVWVNSLSKANLIKM
jgi:hypothetical protein